MEIPQQAIEAGVFHLKKYDFSINLDFSFNPFRWRLYTFHKYFGFGNLYLSLGTLFFTMQINIIYPSKEILRADNEDYTVTLSND